MKTALQIDICKAVSLLDIKRKTPQYITPFLKILRQK
jgi:hypothetical protein